MKILSFGEIIWDVYPDEKYIGGAPFNFAAHARRAGADVFLMSAVGTDTLGAEAMKKVEYYGVNGEYVSALAAYPTGICAVTLDQNKIPSYAIADGTAYDWIPFPSHAPRGFDALSFGTLALRHAHNRAVVDALLEACDFKQVFVDLNVRPPFDLSESIQFALARATVAKISDEELPAVMMRLGEDYAGIDPSVALLKRRFEKLHTILVTCGKNPSVLYDLKSEKTYPCASKKVTVVSTVGAGDCYGAFFLVNYLSGEPIEVCMSKAAEAAAFVVAHAEAIPTNE
ncbi:MAG: hypothetical protein IJW29_00160 [Clostridia bacterium]|nr:hypothetical protein [Clostridia bacterium]